MQHYYLQGGVALTTLLSSDTEPNTQASFASSPPIVKEFIVQKLQIPKVNGENVILNITYFKEPSLPTNIKLYFGSEVGLLVKDDGVYPDAVAGDCKYTSYVKTDIDEFVANIKQREAKFIADGGLVVYNGHVAKVLNKSDLEPFKEVEFKSYAPTPIYIPILSVTLCGNSILKQNSLFITDLAVVEDPARTRNVYANTGALSGAWSFGTLMAGMANTPTSNITTKEFLKQWVKTWTVEKDLTNYNDPYGFPRVLQPRMDAFAHLIAPWIKKVHPNFSALPMLIDPLNSLPSSAWKNNWETYWDQCNETDLVQNAPFKLMAIVNRIDTRTHPCYSGNISPNAGETRFIYTLINPENGKPPFHRDISGGFGANTNDAIDWVGMNVILEYGNPMATSCALRDFAQQWYDLSAFTLGSVDYNDHLQAITDQVVKANKGCGKINGSAINQVRTNEKIFDLINFVDASNGFTGWALPDWELRQFELQPSGLLTNALCTNTLIDDKDPSGTLMNKNVNLNISAISGNSVIDNWVYKPNTINSLRVLQGLHVLPETYLASSARMYKEMTHFYEFPIEVFPASAYHANNIDPGLDAPNATAKAVRHQLSLNTCQGCHNGETKTNFTMVHPRGYGQSADYWGTIPAYQDVQDMAGTGFAFTNKIDARFNSNVGNTPGMRNMGKTYDYFALANFGLANVANANLDQNTNNTTLQIVAPFITGSNYATVNGVVSWEDDELDNDNSNQTILDNKEKIGNVYTDPTLLGLYWLNDPSNKAASIPSNSGLPAGKGGDFPQMHDSKNGFNDLDRRSKDLCNFLAAPCTYKKTRDGNTYTDLTSLITALSMKPLPKGSH